MPSTLSSQNLNAPQCVQFARYLIGEIQSGRIRPGEKLDSVRNLAERFHIGRQIVLSAFALLVKQNFVRSEARRGFFVNPEIQHGYFYRIGFFINRNNPAPYGCLPHLYRSALRYGWQIIPGSNFEEDFELDDWLARKNDLDGVILSGTVDENLLKGVSSGLLPYVVLGNYDIDSRHPQITSEHGTIARLLLRELKQHHCRRIAVFCGPAYLYNERMCGTETENILRENGWGKEDVLIVYARDDGYPEIDRIMREWNPEVLFFYGEHCLGWRRFLHRNPGIKSPLVMINGSWGEALAEDEYDICLPHAAGENLEERAVRKMLELLNVKFT